MWGKDAKVGAPVERRRSTFWRKTQFLTGWMEVGQRLREEECARVSDRSWESRGGEFPGGGEKKHQAPGELPVRMAESSDSSAFLMRDE